MNTVFFRHSTLVVGLLGLTMGGVAAADAEGKPPAISSRPAPERLYRLFVGVDLKVVDKTKLRTVSDFENRRIKLEGKSEIAERDLGKIQFVHSTKLGHRPISVTHFNFERTITATTDERLKALQNQNSLQTYNQDRIQQLELSVISSAAFGPEGPIEIGEGKSVMPEGINNAVNNFENHEQNYNLATDSEFFSGQATQEHNDKFNSIVINATVSSPVPLVETYAVGLARIYTPSDGPKDVVFFDHIGRIGPEPRNIVITKPGLPLGFEIQDLKLHVYREGQELVSDLSEKQFALTRDEALEYLTLERISSHRGETLPAKPAWSLAPTALLASERPADFDFPLTVHVDAKGRVIKVDETTVVPGQITEIVDELMFLPAIDSGVAVPSVVHVNLRDFFQ